MTTPSESSRTTSARDSRPKLIGHWPLAQDARDHSGGERHGIVHGRLFEGGRFDGRSTQIEIASAGLDPGPDDFAIAAWIKCDSADHGLIGDVVSKWDADARNGFNLSVMSSSGGYNAHGSQRGLQFGTDDADLGEWTDCGTPNPTSHYLSNSLTVFDGHLYAATTDGQTRDDWAHVYRYAGGKQWVDCGQLGNGRARGVGPMIVHDGALFAATWSYDWTTVEDDDVDPCRIYRYVSDGNWEDCGQPGSCPRLYSLASFAGKLYVVGDDSCCYVYDGGEQWSLVRSFRNLVHPMAVHHGKLYVGEFGDAGPGSKAFRPTEVFCFDGQTWSSVGCPMHPQSAEDQLHAFHAYEGKLHVTTWPNCYVASLEPDGTWACRGRAGRSTEANALIAHNGKLYTGTIPIAEVYRHDGGEQWTRLARFCPEDTIAASDEGELLPWGRVTALASCGGRLFAGVGSFTSSRTDDAPTHDPRGRVYALRAGRCASIDRDLGSGWRCVVAQRVSGRLEIFLDGARQARSEDADALNLSNDSPLRIGSGAVTHFTGQIRDVRLYHGALNDDAIEQLAADRPRL